MSLYSLTAFDTLQVFNQRAHSVAYSVSTSDVVSTSVIIGLFVESVMYIVSRPQLRKLFSFLVENHRHMGPKRCVSPGPWALGPRDS